MGRANSTAGPGGPSWSPGLTFGTHRVPRKLLLGCSHVCCASPRELRMRVGSAEPPLLQQTQLLGTLGESDLPSAAAFWYLWG